MGYSITNMTWYGVLLGDAEEPDYDTAEVVANKYNLTLVVYGHCHGVEALALGITTTYIRAEVDKAIEIKAQWGSDWQGRLSAALADLGLPDQQAKRYASSHYS